MDFVSYLKSAVITFFSSFKDADAQAVAKVVERWGLELGFNRTGNTTDHRSQIAALRGEATSRVSLDKYTDGSPCIVVNQMQAQDAQHVFLSALHGAILAWRRDSGAKTADGKERLIDEPFTRLAQYVGLMKIAAQKPVLKDGVPVMNEDGTPKMATVNDSTRRVWYGANASLEKTVAEFATSAPALPSAFAGTEQKNIIGTILLPVTVTLNGGAKMAGLYVRIGSYTAAEAKVKSGAEKENTALRTFAELRTNPNITFDTKNKGFKTLASLYDAREAEKAEAAAPATEAQAPVVEPKKKQRAA